MRTVRSIPWTTNAWGHAADEFIARLTAIVPPPRFPRWRYHGVLAPGAPWGKLIVPAATEPDDDGCSHKASNTSSGPACEGMRAQAHGQPQQTGHAYRRPVVAAPVACACCTKRGQACVSADEILRAVSGAAATLLSTRRPELRHLPCMLAAHRGHPAAGCHQANSAALGFGVRCR